MKLDDIYKMAKAIMSEKPTSTTYDNVVVDQMNVILTELFDANNICRVFYGKEPLKDVPLMQSREDDVPYEIEYCREVIPYALASMLEIDDDMAKHSLFEAKYNNAFVKHLKIVDEGDYDALSA